MIQKHTLFLKPSFSAIFIAGSLIFGLLLSSTSTHAQTSKRAMRDRQDDTLSVQQSSPASGATGTATSTGTGSSTIPSYSGGANDPTLSYTASPGKAVAQPGQIVNNATTPVYVPPTNNNNNNGMMQMMQLAAPLMNMLTGNTNNGNKKSDTTPSSGGSGASAGGYSGGRHLANDSTTPGIVSTGDRSSNGNLPKPSDNPKVRNCNTPSAWQPPARDSFRITSCRGNRRSTQSYHRGLDMVIEGTAKIYPASQGTVVHTGFSEGYGCTIIVEHPNCPSGFKGETKCYTQYAHLQTLSNGRCDSKLLHEKVGPCTEIGIMGNTGASQGRHLHFELRTMKANGSDVDPIDKFPEWAQYSNYNYKASSCGTVEKGHSHGEGKTPSRPAPQVQPATS